MTYTRIIGTGHYLPETARTNHDLQDVCDTSHEWIVERSGIEQRHFVAQGEGNTDMAEQAARRALDAAGLTGADLDMIVVGTCSADYCTPSVAALLQDRLGMKSGPAFDVNAACVGWVNGMHVVDQFIKTGAVKRALVIGSERLTPFIRWDERNTAVLFGDGAGAVVVEASEDTGVLSTHMHCDGSKANILFLNNGLPVYEGEDRANSVTMLGQDVYKAAVRAFNGVIDETLAANNMTYADVDWFIPHQANLRIIQAVAKRMDIPDEKVVITVNQTANTSASTIPIALDRAVRDGRIQKGQTILTASFGAGLVWGSALFKF